MGQCIVLDVSKSQEWTDQVLPHPQGRRAQGLHVPSKYRPGLVHATREAAEKEAALLACNAGVDEGVYAVFEIVGVVRGKVLTDGHCGRGLGPGGGFVPAWDDQQGLRV